MVALHARGLEDLPLLARGDALLPEPVRVMSVPGARPRAWAVPSADAATMSLVLMGTTRSRAA